MVLPATPLAIASEADPNARKGAGESRVTENGAREEISAKTVPP